MSYDWNWLVIFLFFLLRYKSYKMVRYKKWKVTKPVEKQMLMRKTVWFRVRGDGYVNKKFKCNDSLGLFRHVFKTFSFDFSFA